MTNEHSVKNAWKPDFVRFKRNSNIDKLQTLPLPDLVKFLGDMQACECCAYLHEDDCGNECDQGIYAWLMTPTPRSGALRISRFRDMSEEAMARMFKESEATCNICSLYRDCAHDCNVSDELFTITSWLIRSANISD